MILHGASAVFHITSIRRYDQFPRNHKQPQTNHLLYSAPKLQVFRKSCFSPPSKIRVIVMFRSSFSTIAQIMYVRIEKGSKFILRPSRRLSTALHTDAKHCSPKWGSCNRALVCKSVKQKCRRKFNKKFTISCFAWNNESVLISSRSSNVDLWPTERSLTNRIRKVK